jgi:hypothetical protein
MRRRTRHVIAVMVVATALCADRSVSAAPVARPLSQGLARTFASKLTTSLRRAVATSRVQVVRSVEAAPVFAPPIREAASGVRSQFSPFQFRLPPPSR